MQQAADEASAQLRQNELLILAANTGFLADVETLVAQGADVACTDKEGTPLMHFPCAKGKLEIVKLLLSKGVDINAEDKQGQTALHYASQSNACDVVKLLVKSGAWVDAYDGNDDTALHLAIRHSHLETVKHLLMSGAKTEITNDRNLTALGEAITARDAEMVKLLMDKGADVHRTANGYSLLHLAAGSGSEVVVEVLLKQLRPDTVIHPGGVTPLHCASLKSVPAGVVRLLISHGADPHTVDTAGRIPLDWAKEEGNDDEEVLKLLSVGDRKKRSRRKNKSSATITEIEPADGPEGEWMAFQTMTYEEKLKQVEVWARSKNEYLDRLIFLDEDSRKAIALVGNFMRMLECRVAMERLKSDETFQEDAIDPQVQKAIAECTENPQSIRKFATNDKIMNVLMKLKRLQEVLKRNGRMKIVYEDLLQGQEGDGVASEDGNISTEQLEKALKSSKEAVIKAVLGGAMAPKGKDDLSNWWGSDGTTGGGLTGDQLKIGSGPFFKTMLSQFVRQVFLAFLVITAMVFGMYLTDSLPSQNSRYHDEAAVVTPAYVTTDRTVHARLQEGNFNPEL